MSGFSDPVPKVARVLLRVEWADGQAREFDADRPHGLEVTIGRPGLPEVPLVVPEAIYGGDAVSVAVRFKANPDSRRHPFTIRDPEAPGLGFCRCLCSAVHPALPGICTAGAEAATGGVPLGDAPVPACGPCEAAITGKAARKPEL